MTDHEHAEVHDPSEFERLYHALHELVHDVRVMIRLCMECSPPVWMALVIETYANTFYGALAYGRSEYEMGDARTGYWYVVTGPDDERPQTIVAIGDSPEEALRAVTVKIEQTNWLNHKRRREIAVNEEGNRLAVVSTRGLGHRKVARKRRLKVTDNVVKVTKKATSKIAVRKKKARI
jgi:hypothetical protein